MADQEFSPRKSLEHALARWWMVVLITFLGGVAGWSFHFFQSPVYEAAAVLTINIDFPLRELTQYEQDHAFTAAGALIGSTAVMEQMVSDAQASGIPIETGLLRRRISWEGRQSEWELHVRDEDPQIAAALANIWVETANEALNAALEHALRADQIQTEIKALNSCLLPATPAPSSTPVSPSPICTGYSLSDIQSSLEQQSKQFQAEQKLSKGLLPIMQFAITGYATVPDKPILYNQGSLALAGLVIGFVISLWVVNGLKNRN